MIWHTFQTQEDPETDMYSLLSRAANAYTRGGQNLQNLTTNLTIQPSLHSYC